MNLERYTMIYNPKISTKELRILGKEFVKNNGNKGKLIINNKKYNLLVEFNLINNFNINKLKINMVSSQNIFNRSYMFMKCKSLIELSIYDSYKDIETDSNNIFIEPEYFLLDQYFAHGIKFIRGENNSENETYSYYSVISENKDEEPDKSTVSDIVNDLSNEPKKYYYFKGMFCHCLSLEYLPDISNWNTSNVFDVS